MLTVALTISQLLTPQRLAAPGDAAVMAAGSARPPEERFLPGRTLVTSN